MISKERNDTPKFPKRLFKARKYSWKVNTVLNHIEHFIVYYIQSMMHQAEYCTYLRSVAPSHLNNLYT